MERFISALFRVFAPTSDIKPGDVVVDAYSKNRVTVERVDGDRAAVVWFEGSTLHRGSLLCRNLTIA